MSFIIIFGTLSFPISWHPVITDLYAVSLSRSCPSSFNIFCFSPCTTYTTLTLQTTTHSKQRSHSTKNDLRTNQLFLRPTHQFFHIFSWLYTVSQKKQDTKYLPITSPNVDRFSKFFHCQTQWQICNKFVFKYPTTP